jgi:hypothetical protein
MELIMTVAAKRFERISGRTLRMDANDRRRDAKISEDESQSGIEPLLLRPSIRVHSLECDQPEGRPPGRQTDVGNLFEAGQSHYKFSLMNSKRSSAGSIAKPVT